MADGRKSEILRCRKTIVRRKQRATRCNYSISVRESSFLSKVSLNVTVLWKFILFFLTVPHPRTPYYRKFLKLPFQTITDWSCFVREVCVHYCVRNSKGKLGGRGKTVEIDEAKIGKRKCNRGRIVEGQWIFGGFERESKEIFVVPVANRSKETLTRLIKKHILPKLNV